MHDSGIQKSTIRTAFDVLSVREFVSFRMPRALIVVAGELGQAFAAARRYDGLRHGARREKSADIPRRIFEEFYAAPPRR